jgi:hypothetical protein
VFGPCKGSFKHRPNPGRLSCFLSIARRRLLTNLSITLKVNLLTCLKYSPPFWRMFNSLRLRLVCGSSPIHPAVSGSLSYRLIVHSRLLSTPLFSDAVTFNYRDYSASLTWTRPMLIKRLHRRTPAADKPQYPEPFKIMDSSLCRNNIHISDGFCNRPPPCTIFTAAVFNLLL